MTEMEDPRRRLALVLDTDLEHRTFVAGILRTRAFDVVEAATQDEAWLHINRGLLTLAVVEMDLPGGKGIEFLKRCRKLGSRIPIIFMSASSDFTLAVQVLNEGGDYYLKKPFRAREFLEAVSVSLHRSRMQMQSKEVQDHLVSSNRELRRVVDESAQANQRLFLGSLSALAQAIDAREPYTQRHSASVAKLASKLAGSLRLPRHEREDAEIAGSLHDVGKLGIPERILLKPSKLTDEEYEVIRSHPECAAQILAPVPGLERCIPAVRAHHERFDGKGYPDGLKGEKIPLLGRILGVCDAWDAMTTDRVYRVALSREDAVSALKEGAGTQFDPAIVQVFLDKMLPRAGAVDLVAASDVEDR